MLRIIVVLVYVLLSALVLVDDGIAGPLHYATNGYAAPVVISINVFVAIAYLLFLNSTPLCAGYDVPKRRNQQDDWYDGFED